MTLNGVMALTLRYFTEFGKPAFQHITASARIELYIYIYIYIIDQKSASITHRAVKFACITKYKNFSVIPTFNLSFKFRFTVALSLF